RDKVNAKETVMTTLRRTTSYDRFGSTSYRRPTSFQPRIEVLEDRWLPSTLVYNAPAGVGPHDLRLVLNGPSLELLDNGKVQFSQPLSSTSAAYLFGANDAADILTVDNSGGLITLTDGIHFTGGAAGGNALLLVGTPGADTFMLTTTYAVIDGLQTVS